MLATHTKLCFSLTLLMACGSGSDPGPYGAFLGQWALVGSYEGENYPDLTMEDSGGDVDEVGYCLTLNQERSGSFERFHYTYDSEGTGTIKTEELSEDQVVWSDASGATLDSGEDGADATLLVSLSTGAEWRCALHDSDAEVYGNTYDRYLRCEDVSSASLAYSFYPFYSCLANR